jgi:hypothetical protein
MPVIVQPVSAPSFPITSGPDDWPVLQLDQNVASSIILDLSPLPTGFPNYIAPSSSSSSSSSSSGVSDPSDLTPQLWIKQHRGDPITMIVSGERTGQNTFRFDFDALSTATPGLFLGDALVFDGTGALLLARRTFIEIAQNATDGTYRSGPITISELRIALRDSSAADNYLLDRVEFSNKEIEYALHRPIDEWNEAPPQVATFTYANFPFRYNHTQAAIGHLLKIAARNYRRNELKYSAAGVTVADKAKASEYESDAKNYLDEWKQWMMAKKRQIDIDGSYGTVVGTWTF